MTAVQAEDMRFLGGYVGALLMGSAKVLGEEGVVRDGDGDAESGSGSGSGSGKVWLYCVAMSNSMSLLC